MLSVVLYAFIAIAVIVAIIVLLVVVLPDDHLARSVADVVPAGLPVQGEVGADDLAQVRIPVAVRGYRMVDTDALLDRLGAEIERRDREIASLRLQVPADILGPTDGAAGRTDDTMDGSMATAPDESGELTPAEVDELTR